ncbi:MAG: cbb3-type cytochrome oxidase assembly protein CcoS [Cellvibrio sp.]
MESLYFLVPCALIFIAIAVKVLFWAINNGQYDNLDTEAHRILFDEKNKSSSTTEEINASADQSQSSTQESDQK